MSANESSRTWLRLMIVAALTTSALAIPPGAARADTGAATRSSDTATCSEGSRQSAADMAASGNFRNVESIPIFAFGDEGDSETVQPPVIGLRSSTDSSCVWAVISHSGDYSRVWVDRRRGGLHEGELGSRMVRSNNDGTYTAPFDANGAEVRACGYTRVPVGMADDFEVNNDQGEVTNDIIDANDGRRFSDVPKWLYKKLNAAGRVVDRIERYGTEPSHVTCTQWHTEPVQSETLAETR